MTELLTNHKRAALEQVGNNLYIHVRANGATYEKKLDSHHTLARLHHQDTISNDDVQGLVSGGHFLITNEGGTNEILDFRRSDFKQHVDADTEFKEKLKHIGTSVHNADNPRIKTTVRLERIGDVIKSDIIGLDKGGLFETAPVTSWSPFTPNILTDFDITRLVCANGMRTSSKVLQTKMSVYNEWEKHLTIGRNQSHQKLVKALDTLIQNMTDQQASVAEVNRVHAMISKHFSSQSSSTPPEIVKILGKLDTAFNLNGIISREVLESNVLAAKAPSHLSRFDLYNILTEVSTHYSRADKHQTDLNILAGNMMFSYKDSQDVSNLKRLDEVEPIDPNMALFGA